jgi:hypothetical protein
MSEHHAATPQLLSMASSHVHSVVPLLPLRPSRKSTQDEDERVALRLQKAERALEQERLTVAQLRRQLAQQRQASVGGAGPPTQQPSSGSCPGGPLESPRNPLTQGGGALMQEESSVSVGDLNAEINALQVRAPGHKPLRCAGW